SGSLWLCKTAVLPFCRTLTRVLHSLSHPGTGIKKSPTVSSGFLFEGGGARGGRTLDTLPYTHFPGAVSYTHLDVYTRQLSPPS
ncbi:hypothetical protein, partial [Erwinia amylovora]